MCPKPSSSPTAVKWQRGHRTPSLKHRISSKTPLTVAATGCFVSSPFLPCCFCVYTSKHIGRGAFSLNSVKFNPLPTFYLSLSSDTSACPSVCIIPRLKAQLKSLTQASKKWCAEPSGAGGGSWSVLFKGIAIKS